MTTRYAPAPGSRLTQADADAIGPALMRLQQQHAQLKPHHVVAAARVQTSPLHAHFEWDDTQAAEKYRLEQARHLLRVITIQHAPEAPEQPPRLIRLFHQVRTGQERHYQDVHTVSTNEDYIQQIIEDARAAFLSARQRFQAYEHLEAFAPLIEWVRTELYPQKKKKTKRSPASHRRATQRNAQHRT